MSFNELISRYRKGQHQTVANYLNNSAPFSMGEFLLWYAQSHHKPTGEQVAQMLIDLEGY